MEFTPANTFLFDYEDFRQPKTPFEGMSLGVLTSTREAKLWISLFVHLKQDQKRSIKPVDGGGTCYQRYICSCKSGTCSFFVTITKSSDLSWKVSKCNLVHQELCFSRSTVGGKMAVYLTIHNSLALNAKPNDLLKDFQANGSTIGSGRQLSVNSSKKPGYDILWLVRRDLKRHFTDSWEDGFAFLPDFLLKLMERNPGSIIVLDTKTIDGGNGTTFKQFYRLFVMFHSQAMIACRSRPVVSYDGAFTKVMISYYVCS
jgi:hypothetical protein